MPVNHKQFTPVLLNETDQIWTGKLPEAFDFCSETFEKLWALHPDEFHRIKFMGKEMLTPRWQQAYGVNYSYTGSVNNALPIADEIQPYYQWCKANIDSRLNGLLLNWYDGQRGHYLGAHRDDIRELVQESPIATISLGEERIFRFRPYKGKGYKDLVVQHGDVVIIPWETNLKWKHEIPLFKKYKGRRLSITLRVHKQ